MFHVQKFKIKILKLTKIKIWIIDKIRSLLHIMNKSQPEKDQVGQYKLIKL